MSAERQLFDIPAAVAYLRELGADSATPSFMRNLINSGAVAHVKVGKKFFVSKETLNNWLARAERRRAK